ncbi:MAG: hypothetical protein R6U91_02025 [Bacillota bacterium]
MRKLSKGRWLAIMLAMALVLSLIPALGMAENEDSCEPCDPEDEVKLIAGQNMEVGAVTITNDDEQICVTYALDEEAIDKGWLIYETHLAITTEYDGIPQTDPNRWGTNPIPGLFPYGDDELEGVESYTECISFGDVGFKICDEVYIAAHAVIEREECDVIEAPYSAHEVVNYEQGVRKDKGSVREGRSDPEAVLTYDFGRDETNFFSLGFKFDDEDDALEEGGWIIVEFEYPILNAPGEVDLMVVEDTWGTYPLETADVYASQDGEEWVPLGGADNTERTVNDIHTESYFDLGDEEMDWAKYIKVVDTTPIDPMPNDADGYDLNTIVALSDYDDCTTYDETAWGNGERFNERGNWGMFFEYKVCEPVVPCDEWIVYGSNLGTSSDPLGFEGTSSDAIFAIDLKNQTVSVAYDPGELRDDRNYPNGNAYDPVNQWLFFATDQGDLYFYDMVEDEQYGPFSVGGKIASGAWYDGDYYYVPQNSAALYKVEVDESGAERSQVGTLGRALSYGDIVFDINRPGVLFGSGGGDDGYYFTYNLDSDEYNELKDEVPHKQLAFASNGVLYGVTALTGDWYKICPETGNETEFWMNSTWNDQKITLTDLADGPLCE